MGTVRGSIGLAFSPGVCSGCSGCTRLPVGVPSVAALAVEAKDLWNQRSGPRCRGEGLVERWLLLGCRRLGRAGSSR